jgi:hypothetical protein
MASLKEIVGIILVATLVALFTGENVATGAMISGPTKVVPSKVKLSNRLLPPVPPVPC